MSSRWPPVQHRDATNFCAKSGHNIEAKRGFFFSGRRGQVWHLLPPIKRMAFINNEMAK